MSRRRGITLVEVLIVMAVVVIGLVVLGWFVASTARTTARKQYDSTMVRSIHYSLVLFGQSNGGVYPLPSEYDKNNTTIVTLTPEDKNTTANILSILMYNSFFSAEVLVSPAERNPRIQAFAGYAFSNPPSATNPQQAMWDPAFSVDFINGIGGTSYAHMIPAGREGGMHARWSSTSRPNEAIIATRGPAVSGITRQGPKIVGADFDTDSNTLNFFGGSRAWRGNVAYNDNHVSFEESIMPASGAIKQRQPPGEVWDDVLFYDEYLPADNPAEGSDHPHFTNAFLGIFTKAGPTMADFEAIWD